MATRVFAAEGGGSRIYKVSRVGYDSVGDDDGGVYTGTFRTDRHTPPNVGEGALLHLRRVFMRVWHTGSFLGKMKAFVDGVQTQAYNSKFITNGNMNRSGTWTLGSNWRVNDSNSGVADQSAPAASDISQALSPAMVAGVSYEVTFTVASRAAGSITCKVGQTSGTARSTNGTFTEVIVAGSGDALLAFSADGTWDGTLDDVSISEMDGALRDQEMVFDVAAPATVGPDGGFESVVEMDINAQGTYIEVEITVDSDEITGVFLPESFWAGYRLIRPGAERRTALST